MIRDRACRRKIKQLIDLYPKLTAEQIINRVKRYDTVSFDVFDTLLKRDVAEPADVFDYVERRFEQKFQHTIGLFREKRLAAWRAAVEAAGEKEICLQDIYEQLTDSSAGAIDEKTAAQLMAIELALEEELSCPNPVMEEVYRYCVREGKRVICISDMYLDEKFIRKLLNRNGYTELGAVYVSSAVGVRKTSGALFRYVLKAEGAKPSSLIHIGDSIHGDHLAARRLGIHTVRVARHDWHTCYWEAGKGLDANTIKAFMSNRLPRIQDRREAIGYEVYGPLLYMFVKWLCERLDANKTILFFARDCYVVKRAYEMMTGSEHTGEYFLASRKSLVMPALHQEISIEQIKRILRSESLLISLADILRKFDLNPERYKETASRSGMSLDTIIRRDTISEEERFLTFWALIEMDVKKSADEKYKGFLNYLKNFDLTKEIQVVDVGWRCSMQYYLTLALSGGHSINGYYIGVKNNAVIRNGFEALFINGEDDERKNILLANLIAFLDETFFSAPHGSVQGYDCDGNVLYEAYEHENDENGRQLIFHLQEGALKFIRDIMNSPLHQFINVDPDMLFKGLVPLAAKPNHETMGMFADMLVHTGTSITRIAAPKALVFYLLHPGKFIYDFANSSWKVAFLKRLFKLPLPYNKIFACMYKAKEKIMGDG